MPEFLSERSSYHDFVSCEHHVIGIPKHLEPGNCNRVLDLLHEAIPQKKFTLVKNTEAEIIKFFHNCFGALKVTFANGMFDIAQKANADYDVIKKWVPEVTGFINKEHLDVPGHDSFRGWSGMCFPDNVSALIGHEGSTPFGHFLQSLWSLNRYHRLASGDESFDNTGKSKLAAISPLSKSDLSIQQAGTQVQV